MPKTIKINIIKFVCIAALCITILPLLILGHFSYPMADDWSYGANVHQCIENGGNVIRVFAEAIEVVKEWRINEPRFINSFLGALQPGIWGEQFYWITAWLMIGSIIVSEFLLSAFLLKSKDGWNTSKIIPVVVPTIMIQLMCVQFPAESFYWWTGAVNYTFIFSVSLLLFIIYWNLTNTQKNNTILILQIIIGVVLAVLVGGDNYATSLSMVCLFFSLSAVLLFKNKGAFWRTLPITVVTVICLIICLLAPGNQTRLEGEFGGTTMEPFSAIFQSLLHTASNIYSWTTWKIVFMLLLIAPFLWKALKDTNYQFKYPVLFTTYTFGIYASQIVATMYVGSNTGGGRMAAILYYAYHVWLLLNFGYWMGWLQRKQISWPITVLRLKDRISGGVLQWFFIVGTILAISIGFEIKTTSTYRACVWLVTGVAKEYADAWEERLEVLYDENVKEVYFTPLPGYDGEMIFYADFQVGENWINSACANYYGKEYVGLAEQTKVP